CSLARVLFFFSSRRRHTRWPRDWSSDVCSSDLFSNALMRIGVSREVTLGPLTRTAAVQLGLAVRSVHYDLAQQDHVEAVTRHLEESEERRVGKECRCRGGGGR